MSDILRIAIIGPEASGKTELAKKLAAHFNSVTLQSVATEEYARLYFNRKKLPASHVLSVRQMRELMKGQSALEAGAAEAIQAKRGIVWVDASTINGPLYSGMKVENGRLKFDLYGVDGEVMDSARKAGYDAFVLCWPHEDLPWVDDGMRAMPDLAHRQSFAQACAAFAKHFYPAAPVVPVEENTWEKREQQALDTLSGMLWEH